MSRDRPQVPPGPHRPLWAGIGLAAQIVFVLSWVVAGFWQGPRYSAVAHFVLAAACRRVAGWEPLARPLTLITLAVFVLLVATGVSGAFGLEGLMERLLALVGAGGIALLAYRADRAPRGLGRAAPS